MPERSPEMVDMAFDVDGGIIPAAYPFALWEQIARLVPQLAKEKRVGVLPIRATESSEGLLLPKRAKLVLRVPALLVDAASRLAGSTLQIGSSQLRLGAGKVRPIKPCATIHAQLVTGAADETAFLDGIRAQLDEMKITAKLVCGLRRALVANRHTIHGFSLVIHDLNPEASLQVQYAGLGEERHLGCGVFVPHKIISGF